MVENANNQSIRVTGRPAGADNAKWLRRMLYAALIVASFFMLAPLAWMCCAIFKTSSDMFTYTLLPYETQEKIEIQDGPEKGTWKVIIGNVFSIGTSESDTVRVESLPANAGPARFVRKGDVWEIDPAGTPKGVIVNSRFAMPDAKLRGGEIIKVGTTKIRFDGMHVPTLQNFRELFTKFNFGRNLLNSFFLTCTATSVSLILSSLGGFALAKYEFAGKRVVMLILLVTMMIPPSLLLAPNYELLVRMGLMNSYLGILLPAAVGAFGMLLFRQAMLGVPDDLIEAARLDGCSEFGIYWKIIMPVVRPMSGAFCLMAFMANWNNFLMPMIVLQSEGLFTVPIALSQTISVVGDNQYGALMAGTFLGILPPAVLFFLLQKEFIAGLTAGAVKG
jgi:ABC-type glycerol-3-phosphate transport system permease component